jgi:hypothetical protein
MVVDIDAERIWRAVFPVAKVKRVLASFLIGESGVTPVDDDGPPNDSTNELVGFFVNDLFLAIQDFDVELQIAIRSPGREIVIGTHVG